MYLYQEVHNILVIHQIQYNQSDADTLVDRVWFRAHHFCNNVSIGFANVFIKVTWACNSMINVSFKLKLMYLFINSTLLLKHLFSLRTKLLVNWSPLWCKQEKFSQISLRSSITYFFVLLMLEFYLFNKEFCTCLGYEFYNESFWIFWVCSLNAASVLHILFARWNEAFIYTVYVGHDVWLWWLLNCPMCVGL